jgi:hypothetical protein
MTRITRPSILNQAFPDRRELALGEQGHVRDRGAHQLERSSVENESRT